MSNKISLIVIMCLVLKICSAGNASEFTSFEEKIKITHLAKDVDLQNGKDVYAELASLYDRLGVVERTIPGMKSLTWVWVANPTEDKREFSIKLKAGTSIHEAISQIAKRRSEKVIDGVNFLVIVPKDRPSMEQSYHAADKQANVALIRQIGAFFVLPIKLRQVNGPDLEKFINTKLREAEERTKSAVPFTLKLDTQAQKRIESLNMVGEWNCEDIFDAVSYLFDLRWRIEGHTVDWEASKRK